MKRRVFLGLAAAGVLAGCSGFGESRMNPRNWFGRSRSRSRNAPAEDPNANPLIPEQEQGGLFDRIRKEKPYEGTLVAEVTGLEVERATGGAIIKVRGLASQQEIYDVRLVPDNEDDEPVGGVLGYELRAVHSLEAPERPREVQAAVFVSDKALGQVREIRVRGAQNERVSRR
ncbi:MAG: hypothetical protein U5K36_01975 [Roseovarius sp.]|nr:hypothetical protein [Roseovarius sp.]